MILIQLKTVKEVRTGLNEPRAVKDVQSCINEHKVMINAFAKRDGEAAKDKHKEIDDGFEH